jgi:hypothetical protein
LRTYGSGLSFGKTVMPVSGRPQNRHPFGFAGLAPLGFIPELLIVEKQLLPGREHKIRAAVNALQHLVLEFH